MPLIIKYPKHKTIGILESKSRNSKCQLCDTLLSDNAIVLLLCGSIDYLRKWRK